MIQAADLQPPEKTVDGPTSNSGVSSETSPPSATEERSPSFNDKNNSHNDAQSEEETSLGLSSADRRFLLITCSVILVLITANLIRMSWIGPPQLLLERGELFQVDINTAGWVEWMQLPDIGEVTARTIIADRESRGPFTSIDDVSRVRGIGPATMKKIRPFLKQSSSMEP